MILKLESCDNNYLNSNKGIYKFYVNEELLNKIKDKLQLNFLNNDSIETIIFNDQIYYCVYVGECDKSSFFDRVEENHIKGNNKSTLRKTLTGILNLEKDELTNLLNDVNKCLFLTMLINDSRKIEDFEKKCINSSIHILNMQKNKFYLSEGSKILNSRNLFKNYRK